MRNRKSLKPLDRFLGYVLGRRPDEFGLVPDENGYVKIKDLLKAVHEEEGWRHVRLAHINELLLSFPTPSVQIKDRLIRATEQKHAPIWKSSESPPKLLYTCVRKRAYPHALEKGISPSDNVRIVLAKAPEMAVRIGRRRGSDPVLLSVLSQALLERGLMLSECGGVLYLTSDIPTGCFTGPPLPKEKPPPRKEKDKTGDKASDPAGSFHIKGIPETGRRNNPLKKKKKGEIAWKKGRRQMKKGARRR